MNILRARVVEGSIPMPNFGHNPVYFDFAEQNFEIIAEYTRENLDKLCAIGREAWNNGTLSKYEILAWAGSSNNHSGDRFLWMFRPDLYEFESVPDFIESNFDHFTPRALSQDLRDHYDRFWKTLLYAISLRAYEARIAEACKGSLDSKPVEASKTITPEHDESSLHRLPFYNKQDTQISYENYKGGVNNLTVCWTSPANTSQSQFSPNTVFTSGLEAPEEVKARHLRKLDQINQKFSKLPDGPINFE